jgi:hypothetical protein
MLSALCGFSRGKETLYICKEEAKQEKRENRFPFLKEITKEETQIIY